MKQKKQKQAGAELCQAQNCWVKIEDKTILSWIKTKVKKYNDMKIHRATFTPKGVRSNYITLVILL